MQSISSAAIQLFSRLVPRRDRVAPNARAQYNKTLSKRKPFLDGGSSNNSLRFLFKEQTQKFYYNIRPKKPLPIAALSNTTVGPNPNYLMSNIKDFYRVLEVLYEKYGEKDVFIHEIIEIVESTSKLNDIKLKYSQSELVYVPFEFLKTTFTPFCLRKMFEPGYEPNSAEHAAALASFGYTLSNIKSVIDIACQARIELPVVSLRIRPLVGITITHAAFLPQNHAGSSESMGIFSISTALCFQGIPLRKDFNAHFFYEHHLINPDNKENFVLTGYLRNGYLNSRYKKALLKIYDLAGKVSGFSSKNCLKNFIKRNFKFSNLNPLPIIRWRFDTFLEVARVLTKANDDIINELIRDQY